MDDLFSLFQRGHLSPNIKLHNLNNLLLLTKTIANQGEQPMFRIIIQFRNNFQHQHNQIQRIICLIREVQLKQYADIRDDLLDEVELDHSGDEYLINLMFGDGLLVEIGVVD